MSQSKQRFEMHLDRDLVAWLRQESELREVSISEVIRQSLRSVMHELGKIPDTREANWARMLSLLTEAAAIQRLYPPEKTEVEPWEDL